MSHTKEPWKSNDGLVCAPDGHVVADCQTTGVAKQEEANAKRIAACVNACAGISTDNLKDNVPVKELARRYNAALRDRDELLTAMETVERYVHDDFVAAGIGQLIDKIKTHNS